MREEICMHGKIECFYDECYCVKIDKYFCGIDTCEQAVFQKIGEKRCLVGADFIVEDIEGIEIEIGE